jgi:cytochrome P450
LSEVLVHKSYEFEKPSQLRRFLGLILGKGLILVEGDEHKFQRKHLTPAFSFRHIKDLYPIFWSKANTLRRCVTASIHENPQADGESKYPTGVVEIIHWANKTTMDIIGVAGLGRDFHSLESSEDEMVKCWEEILEPSTEKTIFFALNILLPREIVALLPWKLNDMLKTTTGKLRSMCNDLLREKKEQFKLQSKEQVDILSVLLASNDFADDMLVDQLLTFLAAG